MEICVSQSTLSQQIKKLEEELGVMLFVRGPRSVELTAAGRDFSAYAKRILAEIQRSREAMHQYTTYSKGEIAVGAIPTSGYLGFHKLIVRFMKAYPGIRLQIHEANTDDLLLGLQAHKIHVAFITSPFHTEAEVDFYPLVSDQVGVLLSRKHAQAGAQVVDLAELAHEPFLMIKSSSGYRDVLIRACHDAGFEPRMILESSHVEMLRAFVEEGVGVALMGMRIGRCLESSSTRVLPLQQLVERQNGLAVLRYRRIPLSVRLFRDFVLKHAYATSLMDE
ncbi:MAG: LysR family transcriptional regulator, partial [Alicyclobacillus sp.]|nr:LysR family transcriptional regulator [Alicyclobacillus sp.]